MSWPFGVRRSRETAYKIAATRLGITSEDYRVHVERGEKWCSACHAWHPIDEMVTRRSSPDGHDNVCRTAALERVRAYQQKRREAAR